MIDVRHGFAFKGEYFAGSGDHVLLTPKNFLAPGGLKVSPERCKYYTGPVDRHFLLAPGGIVTAMTDLKQEAPILGSTGVIPNHGKYLHNQRTAVWMATIR